MVGRDLRLRAASFDNSADQRLQGLRAAQECTGAGLWLTATPGSSQFAASEWQSLLRFRVGAFCYAQGSVCAGCRKPMDSAGDHALSCPSNGTYRRHNHLRDRLFGLGQLAGWAPELEQAIPGSRDRPADLLFRAAGPPPLAVDVTVSHPLRSSASTAVREAQGWHFGAKKPGYDERRRRLRRFTTTTILFTHICDVPNSKREHA